MLYAYNPAMSDRRAARVVLPRAAHRVHPKHITPSLEKVLTALATGASNKEIATAVGITQGTVKVYVSDLLRLTGRQSRLALALWWRDCGKMGGSDTLRTGAAFE